MKNTLPKFITFFATLLLSISVSAEPPNLSLIKNEIKTYHDSGLYHKELAEVIQQARQYIDKQVSLNQEKKIPQKLALVLDIDETSLSNYSSMIKRDFTGTHVQFHEDNMAAKTPVIKPMLALYNKAISQGIKIFFITGRNESERQATQKNLIRAGYADWSGLYLRPAKYAYKSIAPFKWHTRELITHKGYTIIASIGDQYSDLQGGYAKKAFKLPNPFYYLP